MREQMLSGNKTILIFNCVKHAILTCHLYYTCNQAANYLQVDRISATIRIQVDTIY